MRLVNISDAFGGLVGTQQIDSQQLSVKLPPQEHQTEKKTPEMQSPAPPATIASSELVLDDIENSLTELENSLKVDNEMLQQHIDAEIASLREVVKVHQDVSILTMFVIIAALLINAAFLYFTLH